MKIMTALATLSFLFLFSSLAHAAKTAQIISSDAMIYQYPQPTSRVITQFHKGTGLVVSNVPTEGFYKTRLSDGTFGWVSGNDVLVASDSSPSSDPAKASLVAAQAIQSGAPVNPAAQSAVNLRMRKKLPLRKASADAAKVAAARETPDNFRIMIGYGFTKPAYGGLKDNYSESDMPGSASDFGIEGQFLIKEDLFWAIRVDVLKASISDNTVTGNTGATRYIEFNEIPLQVGLIYSPFSSHSFRLGLGAYLGVSLGSGPQASQRTIVSETEASGQVKSTRYYGWQPCGTLVAQFVFGLGDTFGLFGEASYRYDQTGTNLATQATNSIKDTPATKIDYSGIGLRFGVEMRF